LSGVSTAGHVLELGVQPESAVPGATLNVKVIDCVDWSLMVAVTDIVFVTHVELVTVFHLN
jgi:hypothetical protein